jgi:hypothetical protein
MPFAGFFLTPWIRTAFVDESAAERVLHYVPAFLAELNLKFAEFDRQLDAAIRQGSTRLTLQRYLYRRNKYGEMFRDDDLGTDGRGYITLLLRTILESEGNQGALIEPIVAAVAASMRTIWIRRGVEWIAAFDQIPLVDILNKLRELDLFPEKELQHHYAMGIQRRLWRIFGPDVVPAPPKAQACREANSTTTAAQETGAADGGVTSRGLQKARGQGKPSNERGRPTKAAFCHVSGGK